MVESQAVNNSSLSDGRLQPQTDEERRCGTWKSLSGGSEEAEAEIKSKPMSADSDWSSTQSIYRHWSNQWVTHWIGESHVETHEPIYIKKILIDNH